jgi:hypothetical protein
MISIGSGSVRRGGAEAAMVERESDHHVTERKSGKGGDDGITRAGVKFGSDLKHCAGGPT